MQRKTLGVAGLEQAIAATEAREGYAPNGKHRRAKAADEQAPSRAGEDDDPLAPRPRDAKKNSGQGKPEFERAAAGQTERCRAKEDTPPDPPPRDDKKRRREAAEQQPAEASATPISSKSAAAPYDVILGKKRRSEEDDEQKGRRREEATAAGHPERERAEQAATAGGGGTKPTAGKTQTAAEAKRTEQAVRRRAARELKNRELRQQGRHTRKEKYKARKAAKKTAQAVAEAASPKGGVPCQALEAAALAKAGMGRLDPMAVSCFLTGLPYAATDQHVAGHFARVGACTAELLRDAATGKATGKGFVTFATAEQALRAATWSPTRLQKRWINVRLCQPRDRRASDERRGLGEKPEGCLSAVVKCDKRVSEANLWRFFQECEVRWVSRMLDSATGEFRGMAFLDFDEPGMVDRAVAKSGQSLKGSPCLVRYKAERQGSGVPGSARPEPVAKPAADGGRVAAHNRAPPVPPPTGKATVFASDSDTEGTRRA